MKNIVTLAKTVESAQAIADKANAAAAKANADLASAKDALAAAVNGTSVSAPTRQKSRKTATAPTAKSGKANGRKARSTVDHSAVLADLKAGGMTAKAIAEKHGCAIPTVNLIKQKNGLTKARS